MPKAHNVLITEADNGQREVLWIFPTCTFFPQQTLKYSKTPLRCSCVYLDRSWIPKGWLKCISWNGGEYVANIQAGEAVKKQFLIITWQDTVKVCPWLSETLKTFPGNSISYIILSLNVQILSFLSVIYKWWDILINFTPDTSFINPALLLDSIQSRFYSI